MHTVLAKGILSAHNGMNTYRGCTHGCIYCDSRSKCYQMNHDFEDVEVKINAPMLLEDALIRKKKPCMVGTGAMTDPYMHLEDKFFITRKCLEVIERHNCGVTLITKSDRVLRDLDLLKKINAKAKTVIQMTLTTFDDKLCQIIEPHVCPSSRRFEVLKILHSNGIPTVVWLCPILPYINDSEQNLRGIINYCVEAHVYGIICFDIGLTLRDGDREYFYAKLDKYFPGLKQRYIKEFGNAYSIPTPNSEYLMSILRSECEKHNILLDNEELFKYLSEMPGSYKQLSIFDE